MGSAPPIVECEDCGRQARRLYTSVHIDNGDDIRKAWLSSQTESNLAKQGRPMDPLAPKDRIEARHVQKATGRIYIGNRTEGMTPRAQAAIEAGRNTKE